MNNKAQFTQGPTCTCEIVMRTGETLDSSLGDRPCSDISRIVLCPLHTAAPAMYEALQWAKQYLRMPDFHPDNSYNSEEWARDYNKLNDALAQAEGR